MNRPWREHRILVIDTETTGLSPQYNYVWELGFCELNPDGLGGSEVWRFDPPITELDPKITEVTGITLEELRVGGYPSFHYRAPAVYETFSRYEVFASFNVPFDEPFLSTELARAGLALPPRPWLDPLVWTREFHKYERKKTLGLTAQRLGIDLSHAHCALDDAEAAAQIMIAFTPRIGPRTLENLVVQQSMWATGQHASYKTWLSRRHV